MCFKVDCIDLYIIESLWQKSLQLRVLFSNGDMIITIMIAMMMMMMIIIIIIVYLKNGLDYSI